MKKALVILLALTMVMSMFAMLPFGASAAEELAIGEVAADYKPEGTAIKTAEEFATMAADGTYYLAENITVDATYMESFTGTFDGNGKTITTSVTLFECFNGVLKNLTVEGAVNIDTAPYTANNRSQDVNSPIAHHAALNADTTIENVCNKAHMTSSTVGMAGIVGMGGVDGNTEDNSVLTVKNCANYGNITTQFEIAANQDSGGIVGKFFGRDGTEHAQLVIDSCVNYGTLNAFGRPGGILGVSQASASIINCVNNGAVQAIDNYCGGIAGRLGENAPGGGSQNDNVFVVENCTNNGDLSYKGAQTAQIGGIVGYLGAAGSITFKGCTNNGDISATPNTAKNVAMGGIFANGDSANAANQKLLVEDCVNNGDITTGDGWVDTSGTANSHYAVVGGMTGRVQSATMVTYKNCVNNGDISGCATVDKGKATRTAGGMVGFTQHDAEFINCINNGDVSNTLYCGGIIGYNGVKNKFTKNLVMVGCGNTGDISGTTQVGGLVGYVYASWTRGPEFTYCFNVGTVTCDTIYASGLLGYTNAGTGFIKYCYVGGEIISNVDATPISSVAAGTDFTAAVQYTFEDNGKNYYFYLPYDATALNIAGNTMVPTYKFYEDGSAANGKKVVDGTDVAAATWCYFTSTSGKAMAFKSTDAGAVSIDGETVKIGDVEQDVTCLDVHVSDHPLNGQAFLWSKSAEVDIDMDKNIVVEGAAGTDYVMGSLGTFVATNVSDIANKYTVDQLNNGTVAFKLNELAGEQVFFQNLDAELFNVDLYPTTDKSHAKVVEVGGVLTNEVFDTTNDSGSPSTGDATIYVVVALAVSTISLAAVAVVRKNKEN